MHHIIIFLISILLSSCASKVITYEHRVKLADDVAHANGMTKNYIKAGKFWVASYQRITDTEKPFAVYLEGDGYAYTKYSVLSDNPTPRAPILLKIAAQDMRPNVIYLARPCQYTSDQYFEGCTHEYWSFKRMSKEIVSSINEAIKTSTHDHPVNLLGYSGGGGIAVLIAARNENVHSLVTLAGNLDHVATAKYHHHMYLRGSLNPIEYVENIRHLPQIHYSGERDPIVPQFIAEDFTNAVNDRSEVVTNVRCATHVVLPDVSHTMGWLDKAAKITNTEPQCVGY